MIQKFKFTEIFLTVMDFYPKYMYMGKTIKCSSLYDDNNLGKFNDGFVEEFLEDNFHMIYSQLSFEMYRQFLFKDDKKIIFDIDDVICMYDIDIDILHKTFHKKHIYSNDIDASHKEDIKNGKIIYIDDYTDEFAKEWKNRKKYYKN